MWQEVIVALIGAVVLFVVVRRVYNLFTRKSDGCGCSCDKCKSCAPPFRMDRLVKEEYFPLVDEQGKTIGKATRKECHSGSMLLHPVVHLHIFNEKGELYLQKRSETKDIQPGKWDTAVGGHVDFGEKVEDALRREAREELGVVGFVPTFIERYIFESEREKEMVYAFRTVYAGAVVPDKEELSDGKYWTIEDVEAELGKGTFTPNFENEYKRIIRSQWVSKD